MSVEVVKAYIYKSVKFPYAFVSRKKPSTFQAPYYWATQDKVLGVECTEISLLVINIGRRNKCTRLPDVYKGVINVSRSEKPSTVDLTSDDSEGAVLKVLRRYMYSRVLKLHMVYNNNNGGNGLTLTKMNNLVIRWDEEPFQELSPAAAFDLYEDLPYEDDLVCGLCFRDGHIRSSCDFKWDVYGAFIGCYRKSNRMKKNGNGRITPTRYSRVYSNKFLNVDLGINESKRLCVPGYPIARSRGKVLGRLQGLKPIPPLSIEEVGEERYTDDDRLFISGHHTITSDSDSE